MATSIPLTPDSPRVATRASAGLSGPLARTVLLAALAAGVAGDALVHDGPAGAGFPLWIGIVGLCAIALIWRAERALTREAAAWLCTAFLFSIGLAWRGSEILQFFDFIATAGALGMAAVSVRDGGAALFAARTRDTFLTAAAVIGGVIGGALPLALESATHADRREGTTRARWALVRAVAIGVAVLLVFGSLLRGADPIFASLVRIPDFDAETLIAHLFVIGILTWIVSGWTRSALVTPAPRGAPVPLPFALEQLDVTIALGTLNVLFAAFVMTQIGWFFGGEHFLQQRTGLTAAAYAREGFFQMVWVVLLVVPVLLATRAMMRPGAQLARRHTLLSLPIIVLLAAIIVSALLRMRLYVQYYGLTTDRFYPMAFMLWLGVVLAWLAVTVLREWARPFAGGVAISGLLALAVLNVADPDAIVARVNVDRAAHARSPDAQPLDLGHLATLSGGGVAIATQATLATPSSQDTNGRCVAARQLLRRFGPASRERSRMETNASWRYWNADDAAALRIVGDNARALRHVAHDNCGRAATR